ncbi:MAG TPA: 2OG-Fe(II) oxygenase [Thermoanaerobaculia bacterium]
MFDTLLIRNFVDPHMAQRIAHQLLDAPSIDAPVYAGGDQPRVEHQTRRADLLSPDAATAAFIDGLLKDAQPAIAKHFGVNLNGFETPQYLRYTAGGFFVAHQDGNVAILRDESLGRRVSIVIFLNARSDDPAEGAYGGGELTFHGKYPHFDARHVVAAEPGSLVAFRSETTHEVTPVAHGERYTIVSWYRE